MWLAKMAARQASGQSVSFVTFAFERKWWNWQTHHLEGVAPKGMGVQVPPSAPRTSRQCIVHHAFKSLALFFCFILEIPESSMNLLITIVHIFVCFFLIIVVLLQSGQSGDIAAAFGGMGSQTAFGPRGAATVLTKATTWCAIIFMITSITLSITASRRSGNGSVLQNYKSPQTQSQPAKPASPQK